MTLTSRILPVLKSIPERTRLIGQSVAPKLAHAKESLGAGRDQLVGLAREQGRAASDAAQFQALVFTDGVDRAAGVAGPHVLAAYERFRDVARAAGQTSVNAVKDHKLAAGIAGVAVLAGAATGAGVAMNQLPSFRGAPSASNVICEQVPAPSAEQQTLKARLQNGTTVKIDLSQVARGKADPAALCEVRSAAVSTWMSADAGLQRVEDGKLKVSGDVADTLRDTVRKSRVTVAQADLALLQYGQAKGLFNAPEATHSLAGQLGALRQAQSGTDNEALVKDYLALGRTAAHNQIMSKGLAGLDVKYDRVLVNAGTGSKTSPLGEGGSDDPVLNASAHLKDQTLANGGKTFASLNPRAQTVLSSAFDTVVNRADPEWVKDHPGEKVPAAVGAQVEEQIHAGTSFAEVNKGLSLAYRATPEAWSIHGPEVIANDVASLSTKLLKGAPPPADMAADAQKMWTQKTPDDQIRSHVNAAIRGSQAYRNLLVAAGTDTGNTMGTFGLCAAGVERSLSKAYGIQAYGNANDLPSVLPSYGFQQANMSVDEALQTPGAIIVWQKSNHSAAGLIYGHVVVVLNDGRVASDHFEPASEVASGRTGPSVWLPAGAANS